LGGSLTRSLLDLSGAGLDLAHGTGFWKDDPWSFRLAYLEPTRADLCCDLGTRLRGCLSRSLLDLGRAGVQAAKSSSVSHDDPTGLRLGRRPDLCFGLSCTASELSFTR